MELLETSVDAAAADFIHITPCSLLPLQHREQLVHHQSGRHPLWSHDFTESGSLTENNYICCADGWEQAVAVYVRHSTITMLFIIYNSYRAYACESNLVQIGLT